MVSGVNGLASDAPVARSGCGARENSPARKPLRYARCSAVNGALSGRTGTNWFMVSGAEELKGYRVEGLKSRAVLPLKPFNSSVAFIR